MGIFFDLYQQAEIEKQQEMADDLEERIKNLEAQLLKTNELLRKTLHALEMHLGQDIDGDGITG